MFLLSCSCLSVCLSAWSTIFFLLSCLCDSSFLSPFIHVSLSWLLSFCSPVLVFLYHLCCPSVSLSLPVSLVSLHYPSLYSGERCLTRSPWSSRVQWRESWVWWTTCPALSATSTRCPPSPASTVLTRRSIITSNTTDDSPPPFHPCPVGIFLFNM